MTTLRAEPLIIISIVKVKQRKIKYFAYGRIERVYKQVEPVYSNLSSLTPECLLWTMIDILPPS